LDGSPGSSSVHARLRRQYDARPASADRRDDAAWHAPIALFRRDAEPPLEALGRHLSVAEHTFHVARTLAHELGVFGDLRLDETALVDCAVSDAAVDLIAGDGEGEGHPRALLLAPGGPVRRPGPADPFAIDPISGRPATLGDGPPFRLYTTEDLAKSARATPDAPVADEGDTPAGPTVFPAMHGGTTHADAATFLLRTSNPPWVTAVFGRSGSGKSTLLHTVACRAAAQAQRIWSSPLPELAKGEFLSIF
jgi:hypothetical protein